MRALTGDDRRGGGGSEVMPAKRARRRNRDACAMSAGFSNLYYPPPSRTRGAIFSHFVIDVADNGFVNLAPEFWPDFRAKVFHRHHRHPNN